MNNPWDNKEVRVLDDIAEFRDKETERVQRENIERKNLPWFKDETYLPNDAMSEYMRQKRKEPRRKAPQLGRCNKCKQWTLVGDINDSCCGDEHVEVN